MSSENGKGGAKAPVEHVDKKAAKRGGEGGVDRPGFDLGGANEKAGSNARPNPLDPAADPGEINRSTGVSGPSGSRSLGEEGDAGPEGGSGATQGSGSKNR